MATEEPTTKINLSTLATAWLDFRRLAGEATDPEIRDAFALAQRIADSHFDLRAAVLDTCKEMELCNLLTDDTVRALRHALNAIAES